MLVRDVVQGDSGQLAAARRLIDRCVGEVALQLYREGSPDFAECLHIALATEAGEHPPWTFGRGASLVAGAQRVRTR